MIIVLESTKDRLGMSHKVVAGEEFPPSKG